MMMLHAHDSKTRMKMTKQNDSNKGLKLTQRRTKALIPKMMETTPKDDVGEETVKTTSLGAAHQLLGQQGCSGDDEKEAHSTQG
ncbi:hypothetical protein Fmac_032958 [Flemingia macrophylla]|uniref:Uncharacterized protein n=1 Tax=Flemingia macrophylla TaxID=520843 RepID=A0ABD1L6E0_9FABA